MKSKTLMLLGGISYLLPAIESGHRHGCHVVTVDYLPDNIAHKYSDEYHNVSITDRDAVLDLARRLDIDGILSFGVDPGVVTAAYVAEALGLPFSCPYHSACILQDKSLFRQFLADNGFNVPLARGYQDMSAAIADVPRYRFPVIVKPVDSAGSKGVSRADTSAGLRPAITKALSKSRQGRFIVEEYLESEGLPSGSESFFVDGKLCYNGFYDQYYDHEAGNPYAPSSESWPSFHSQEQQDQVRHELQRLGDLLHFGTGLFNVEWRVSDGGKVYLMEVSPRAGGNRLAEMLRYAADVDLIDAEVSKAIGAPLPDIHEPRYNGYHTIYILHSLASGKYDGIEISDDFEGEILETEVRVAHGDGIEAFEGANNAIGTLFIRYPDRQSCERSLSKLSRQVKIKTR